MSFFEFATRQKQTRCLKKLTTIKWNRNDISVSTSIRIWLELFRKFHIRMNPKFDVSVYFWILRGHYWRNDGWVDEDRKFQWYVRSLKSEFIGKLSAVSVSKFRLFGEFRATWCQFKLRGCKSVNCGMWPIWGTLTGPDSISFHLERKYK